MSSLTLRETTTTDRYDANVTVAKTDRDKAAEVVEVVVEVIPLTEDGKDFLHVDVRMYGYLLAASGKRLINGTRTQVYGTYDAEDRWSLAREALLATLTRLGFDLSNVESMLTETWDEYRAATLKRLGF